MQGLKLFTRTSGRRCWNIASFHSPHSLTWSWILSLSLPRGDEGRWLHFARWQTNQGRQWCLQIARCGLQWHRQRPMWFRDCYYRLRDKQDGLLPPDERPLPHQITPTIIGDGGQSLH
jgi:hypothetical protein